MNKKQRLLNAVKTLNLTLEQRQELVEAIEDFGGSSGKILNLHIGFIKGDNRKMFLEINNVKIIQDLQDNTDTLTFSFTKDELFKQFNISNIFDIAEYKAINFTADAFFTKYRDINNSYIETNIIISPDNSYGELIQFIGGMVQIMQIMIIGNDVEFRFEL